MPDFNDLYTKYNGKMEDFWSRHFHTPKHENIIHVFGHPVIFDSNHEKVLECALFAEEMYSMRDSQSESTWRIHITVHSQPQPAPPPERLVDLIRFTGTGDWLSIDLRDWGNCFVDMKRGEAYAVLSSSLAEKPEQVCQVLINTILTNFITRHGYSMLHASALIKDGNILLLQAPHGAGKSTTALRLLLNGYQLLSDSMVYIRDRGEALWMGGFPIGRIKLRPDILPLFPALAARAQKEPVRSETKHRIDLKRTNPEMTHDRMIQISHVEYCLLERWDRSESRVQTLSEEELWPEIMVNSLHYDSSELWIQNLRCIEKMLKYARLHRLRIGSSEAEIIKTVNGLW
jgi:hypothetical protein